MIPLTNLTDDAIQQVQVALADGSLVSITLTYRAATQRWTLDVSHPKMQPNGAINGVNLCVHPNILRKFRRIIPFGLACVSSDGQDPVNLEDFVSGRIQVYILDSTEGNTEVQDVEANIFGAGAIVT